MRITRIERFDASVKRYIHRFPRGGKNCCKCDDNVYKEDMWKRWEFSYPNPEGRWFYVCDTCMKTHEEAVIYFKNRVDFSDKP
jgi:hypothetical protein